MNTMNLTSEKSVTHGLRVGVHKILSLEAAHYGPLFAH